METLHLKPVPTEVNPDWVAAPYRVDFLFWFPGPPKAWSRKRRLKWLRRKRKSEMKKFIHPGYFRPSIVG